ncbi:MAG TPA: hypothetical protein VH109_11590 [Steroidobacteraceae bacterium]|jgi:hypothetical protein|nr:hypothetical protein [Steroidobacteraceae bacterium]
MRTGLSLLAGFLLLGACLILGRLFSAHYRGAAWVATIVFVCLWLAISVGNMWVGVTRAGYAVADELPILLLIFSVPVIVAIVLKWRLS